MFTYKQLSDFPKYRLRSDGLILYKTGHGLKSLPVRKDKGGFKYVILYNEDTEKKVFLFALKFPRGKGYENVMRLKKKEERKLKRLKDEARKVGRHHRSLRELRRSLQKYERRATKVEPE